MNIALAEEGTGAVPVVPLSAAQLGQWLESAEASARAWVTASGFTAEAGSVLAIPRGDGGIARVLFGRDDSDPWSWAQLEAKLPPGTYRIDMALDRREAGWAALAWLLGGYRFERYKSAPARNAPSLVWPAGADRGLVSRTAAAVALVRDLVNTPSSDMGPEELAQAATDLAKREGARIDIIVGDDLLRENYPAIHTVGRASLRAPRLVDMRWGEEDAPRITLIGKGVCFDSGGLDLKPSSGMKLMKKDMGGAAHVLGLASMIMDARLPVRLRVLIPAVENAVSGNAMRPLDVIRMRNGTTVEVGNTDAEGRLILADCLAEADSEKPALLFDLATLTGAARTALGPELPALFTPDDTLADALLAASREQSDPFWRLPLWANYRRMLDSKVAAINSAPDSPFAGSITAALFLKEFVAPATPWAHLDIFAWNPTARPGRPEGGEAMAIRALYHLIAARYG